MRKTRIGRSSAVSVNDCPCSSRRKRIPKPSTTAASLTSRHARGYPLDLPRWYYSDTVAAYPAIRGHSVSRLLSEGTHREGRDHDRRAELGGIDGRDPRGPAHGTTGRVHVRRAQDDVLVERRRDPAPREGDPPGPAGPTSPVGPVPPVRPRAPLSPCGPVTLHQISVSWSRHFSPGLRNRMSALPF